MRDRTYDREYQALRESHGRLVEALKGLVSAADYMAWPQEHETWHKARQALKEAEEI